jgi:hypothetical protein
MRTTPTIAAASIEMKRTETVARGPVPCRTSTVSLSGRSTGLLVICNSPQACGFHRKVRANLQFAAPTLLSVLNGLEQCRVPGAPTRNDKSERGSLTRSPTSKPYQRTGMSRVSKDGRCLRPGGTVPLKFTFHLQWERAYRRLRNPQWRYSMMASCFVVSLH